MKAILIPVKTFGASKTRLASQYSEPARAALASALCEDFFAVVAQVRSADRVFVVSREPRALQRAQANGWEIIAETEQISESQSVDHASQICAERGIDALLRLPMDLPLVTAGDIDAILAEADEPPHVVIIPSRDGTGTNALLRSPPTLFPSHFGPNSFAQHLEEAARCGARVKTLHNPRIELDIDERDDLNAVAEQLHPQSAVARWMIQHRP